VFTAAGNDRFTAIGQWVRRAGQADLARLHARETRSPADNGHRMRRRFGWSWIAWTRGPWTRSRLGGRPDSGRGGSEPTSASVRGYRGRRFAGVTAASYRTVTRRLSAFAGGSWRQQISAACAAHASLGPASLVLYDVSTLYFETDAGTGSASRAFRRSGGWSRRSPSGCSQIRTGRR
jgi:hypothetical protein